MKFYLVTKAKRRDAKRHIVAKYSNLQSCMDLGRLIYTGRHGRLFIYDGRWNEIGYFGLNGNNEVVFYSYYPL